MIGDAVPVIQHSPAPSAEKTRAIDAIVNAVQSKFKEPMIYVMIIIKFSVLNKRVFSSGVLDCHAYRCVLDPILRTPNQSYQIGMTFRRLLDEIGRPIRGSVIDDNYF